MNQFQRELQFALTPEIIQKFPELSRSLLEKKFSVIDTDVSNRLISHWQSKGLLALDEKGKWRKFDFVEFAWIKIIVKLRQFHIGLEAIKALKQILMDVPEDFMKELLDSPGVIKTISAAEKSVGREGDENKIAGYLQLPHVRENLLKIKPPPPLYFMILDTLLMKSHYPLLVNPKGKWLYLKESYIEYLSKEKFFEDFLHSTYLSLSLTEILSEYIQDEDVTVSCGQLHLVTKEEAEVLKAIRAGNLKSLKIRFNEKEEISLLELTEEKKIDRSARFTDVILNHGYQLISVATQDGKIVHYENTRKIKPAI